MQNQVSKQKKVIFTFVSPANSVRSSLASHKRALTDGLQSHRSLEDGLLLETMETGVLFPVIHHSELSNTVSRPSMLLIDGSALDRDAKLQQGLYAEIRSFTPSVVPSPATDAEKLSCFKACIFMGFKTLDDTFSEVLEDNWKDWTGARLVYLNLSDEFGLSKLSFFRRQSPKDLDVFMYIMTVECDFVNASNRIRLLDFVQRLRVERMMGYLSVYRVTRKPPSTANIINGLLSEAVDTGADETAI